MLYADIIIPLALPKNFTWSIPAAWANKKLVGCRVEVLLGKSKRYAGIVKQLHHQPPNGFEPKPIINIIDEEPLVYPKQLQLWEWISKYYMCTEGEVMQAALPAHFKLSSETILICNEDAENDFTALDDQTFLVAEALQIKKELRLTEVHQILDGKQVYAVIKKLIEAQICLVWESLTKKYKEKKDTFISLQTHYNNETALATLLNANWSKAPKQLELLLAFIHLYKTEPNITQKQLLTKAGATATQLKALIDKNILIAETRSVDRLPDVPKLSIVNYQLSIAQQLAYQQIQNVFKQKAVCLLHGITASGKTEIYIKLIEEKLAQGKQTLYILPEIALTGQIIRRLQKHFGGNVAVYHSKFNLNERVELWNKVKSGQIKIILGARSALFLPFKNLSFIIIDEEHDTSFKQQDPAPRYHARDTAIYYSSLYNAQVLLGSATPSIESYYNAQQKKYGLVNLTERFGEAQLPQIEIIDTKIIPTKDRSKIILSPILLENIATVLQKKEQIILFQNRRGYTLHQICSACSWIPHCEHCDVTLTYHKTKNQLQCHYCGSSYPLVYTCAACGSHQFVQRSFGTEKIEELLAEHFPQARIARMDIDSVRGKHDHEKLIQLFEQHRIDILVGTQMVVKGFDFEKVSLVGIVDADALLSFAHFRVNERAFQLIQQVSGRAGRKDANGKVCIQIANPQHPILVLAQQHNYAAFVEQELKFRQQFNYPPFTRILMLRFKHKHKDIAEQASQLMLQLLPIYKNYITGPAEPVINRIQNKYIYELMIKLPKDALLIQNIKQSIQDAVAVIHNRKGFSAVQIVPDVDAY